MVQFAVQINGCILKNIILLHYLQWKLDTTILYSLCAWNGCVIHEWAYLLFATAKGFLKTWLVLWKIPDAVLVRYAAFMHKPIMLPFRCLLPFVSTYLCHQGVDIRGGERETATSGPPFSEIPQVGYYTLRVLHLVFAWLFSVINRIYFEITKHIKSIQFGRNVQQDKQDKRSQWKKRFLYCSVKKLTNHSKATF